MKHLKYALGIVGGLLPIVLYFSHEYFLSVFIPGRFLIDFYFDIFFHSSHPALIFAKNIFFVAIGGLFYSIFGWCIESKKWASLILTMIIFAFSFYFNFLFDCLC